MKDLVEELVCKKDRQPKIKTVSAYTVEKDSPYAGPLSRNNELKRAFTVAALVASNLCALSSKGLATKGQGKAHPELFARVVGQTAANYWSKWIDGKTGKLSTKGLNKVTLSFQAEKGAYRTTIGTYSKLVPLVRKGGRATIKTELREGKFSIALKQKVTAKA